MKVQTINQDGQQSFAGIYKANVYFTKKQKNLVNKIVQTLKKDFQDSKVFTTLEKKYENYGYDFILKPLKKDKVSLNAYPRLQDTSEIGKEKYIHIGKYDEKNSFETRDLQILDKNLKRRNFDYGWLGAPIIIISMLCALIFTGENERTILGDAKPLIENIDSGMNKTKEFILDSAKVLKKIPKIK